MDIKRNNILYDLHEIYNNLKKNKRCTSFRSICLAVKTIEMYNRPFLIRFIEYSYLLLNIILPHKRIQNITIGQYQQKISYILDKCNIIYEIDNEKNCITNIKIHSLNNIKKFILSIDYPYAIIIYYKNRSISRKYIFSDKDLKDLSHYYSGETDYTENDLNYYVALKSLYLKDI